MLRHDLWRSKLLAVLWLFAAAALIAGLWSGSLHIWDEGLTGERARETLVTGHWLTPQFQYAPDFNKPPLYYWLVALMFRAIGIGEFAVRLPSVLFALGCLEFVRRAARDLAGTSAAGLWAMFVLAANPHWINQAREGLLDTGLALGMVASLWLLTRRPGRPRDAWLAGVALGLAALLKTPMALAIVPPFVAVCAAGRSRRAPAIALLVGLAVALPWYAAETVRHGAEFVRHFFFSQHWSQMVDRPQQPDRPMYFYLITWMADAPCSFVVISAAGFWTAWRARRRDGRPDAPLAAWWLALVLLLAGLTLASSKRPEYLAEVYPIAAVVSGVWMGRVLAAIPGPRFRVLAPIIVAAVTLIAFSMAWKARLDGAPHDKALGRTILKANGPDRVFLVYNHPVNSLIFYSQGRPYYADAQSLPARIARWQSEPTEPLLLVSNQKDLTAIRQAFEDAGAPAPTVREHSRSLLLIAVQPPDDAERQTPPRP